MKTIKKIILALVSKLSRLPFIWAFIHAPAVRKRLRNLPGFMALYGGWGFLHPFDRAHGTDTSGFVPSTDLPPSQFSSEQTYIYGGSQPSILRSILAMLPPLETFTFVDLGCGKGRPSLVATEFPFWDIVGVELSPALAEIARANAQIVATSHPGRTPARVELGDAGAYQFPAENFVLFLYNPFGEEIMTRVVTALEAALAGKSREVYIVYYNPVFGACLDASPALKRFYAASVPYAREEIGFGPDTADVVVVWHGGDDAQAHAGADVPIVVTSVGLRAELAA